jgi:hypothetical protein
LGFLVLAASKLIATLKEEPQGEQEDKVLLFSAIVKPLKFSSELKTVLRRVPRVVRDFVVERGISEEAEKSRSRTAEDSWFLFRSFGRGE